MKKKIKNIIVATSFLLCGIILGGCVTSVKAEQTYPLKIWKENRNGQMETWKIVDEETGVNYIVVAPNYSKTGTSYDGIAITPRLNADGSLYTGK